MKHLRRLFYPPAWSIRAKLSVALLSVAIVPMSFTAYYNLQKSLESVEASEYRKLELLAISNASRLDQLITDIQRVVIQLSTDRNVVGFLSATTNRQRRTFRSSMQSTLENVFRSSSDYDAVYLIDKEGRCVASSDSAFLDQNYGFREYFREAIQGRSYVSSILVGKTTGRPGLFFSNPVRSEDGEIVGVAVFKIKGSEIWAIVDSLGVDSQSYAFLIFEHGVVISHPNKNLLYQSLTPLPPQALEKIVADSRYGLTEIKSLDIPDLASAMVGAKETGHISYYSPLEQTYQMVGFAPLKMEPWVLGVNKPKVLFAAPLNLLIWQISARLLVVGVMAAIIALLLARSIGRPIRALTSAAEALEKDKFHPDTLAEASRSQDDIGNLVRVFLQMASQVKAREEKLKQQVIDLRVEIDEAKRASLVAEITENEHFMELQKKIQKFKNKRETAAETETDGHHNSQNNELSFKEEADGFEDRKN